MNEKIVKLEDQHKGQFLYLGRWVDKKTFRAFVYDKDGAEKLASSYDEFMNLTSTGTWFASKPETETSSPIKGIKRSKKDVSSSDS